MTSLLTKLPSLGLRPADGLSSRLACHVLGHRAPNAVVRPWVTRRQMRFSSSKTDALGYNNPRHYATLGLEPSATPGEINTAWTRLNLHLHPDITGKKSKANAERYLEVQAAGDILRYPERKAKYDALHRFNKPAQPSMAAKQPSAASRQRGAIGLKGSLFREAVKYREQQQRKEARDKMAARAAAEAQAAEAKKRDEVRKAQELADHAASKAKAEVEKKNTDDEDPAIRAARAAKKRADSEAADARRKAAAQARKAELAKQRSRGARQVVLRHVPVGATAWDFTRSLDLIQAGRILDVGCKRGIAWVEFPTAGQAKALHSIITETGYFTIGETRILNAELRQGTVPPPQGPELITRCLRIAMPAEFLVFLEEKETPNGLMARKLRERGFWKPCVGYTWGNTFDGKWLVQNHFSIANAQSAKAAIEEYYPQLGVAYVEDHCGGLPQAAREDALEASGSDKKEDTSKGSGSDKTKPKADHWLAPQPFEIVVAAIAVIISAIATQTDTGGDKSSDDKKQ